MRTAYKKGIHLCKLLLKAVESQHYRRAQLTSIIQRVTESSVNAGSVFKSKLTFRSGEIIYGRLRAITKIPTPRASQST